MNEARATLLFLCGVHDAGKASPAFEMMNQRCATRTQHTGLTIEYDFFGVENRLQRIRHELVGYHDLRDWLTARTTARPGTCDQGGERSRTGTPQQTRPTLPAIGLANVVGGHHGTSISDGQQLLLRDSAGARLAGLSRTSAPSDWQRCRFELFDWMAAANGIDAISPTWPQRPIPKRSQTLLTAAVIVCDWIASNTRYFPLNTSSQDETTFDADARAARAWKESAYPRHGGHRTHQ